MVRHEAAEALGGIASDGFEGDPLDEALPSGGVLGVLRDWAVKEDAPEVVRESCQVAIDMWEVSLLITSSVGGKDANGENW
jgi:deoxyhypusine monooxygenase